LKIVTDWNDWVIVEPSGGAFTLRLTVKSCHGPEKMAAELNKEEVKQLIKELEKYT
jgi:hypothetical protein